MSRHGSARAVLAGLAVIAVAGCVGTPTGTAPNVPGPGVGSTSASTAARAASPASSASARPGTTTVTAAGQGIPSKSFAKANSIPFPVAVGNTWVYQTNAGGAAGRTTNRIVAAGPGSAGYRVTMTSTVEVAGTATAIQPVYVFYPDGTVGYPLPQVNGMSLAGAGIRWPAAAALASGRAYHSVLRVLVTPTGQYENADVTVHGAGTASVTVPAGTYQASVVEMTIRARSETIEETSWIAQGIGPVKTVVLIHPADGADPTTTNELLSFSKAVSIVGDGS